MSDFVWRGDLAEKIAKEAGMQALRDGMEGILAESQNEVPHETGTLQRSGAVTDAPSENAVYISYSQPYALRQHEDLTFKHEPGRKAKYLEDPFNRYKAQVQRMAQQRIKEALQDAK